MFGEILKWDINIHTPFQTEQFQVFIFLMWDIGLYTVYWIFIVSVIFLNAPSCDHVRTHLIGCLIIIIRYGISIYFMQFLVLFGLGFFVPFKLSRVFSEFLFFCGKSGVILAQFSAFHFAI